MRASVLESGVFGPLSSEPATGEDLARESFSEQGTPGESRDGKAVAGSSDENPVKNFFFDHIKIHEGLRLSLSEQKFRVLNQCLEGNTYREIALKLDISESSVKTCMKRICDKMGATGRRDLFRRLAEDNF